MRTLGEIIDAVQMNEDATLEECKYALLALRSLHFFDHHELQNLAMETASTRVFDHKHRFEESWNRSKRAMAKDPKAWVGWDNDPENPAYRQRVKTSLKFVEKFFNKT